MWNMALSVGRENINLFPEALFMPADPASNLFFVCHVFGHVWYALLSDSCFHWMFWTTCVDRVCVCPWSKVLSDAAPKPQLAPGPVCKCAQSFLGLGRKCKMIQFSQFSDIWRRNAREHGCKMIKMSGLRMWIAVDWNLESQCDGHNASQHQTTNAVCKDVNIKRKDLAKNSLCDMQTERSASMFLHFPGHWEQRREFPESWERVEPGSECVGSNMINEYQWSIIYIRIINSPCQFPLHNLTQVPYEWLFDFVETWLLGHLNM